MDPADRWRLAIHGMTPNLPGEISAFSVGFPLAATADARPDPAKVSSPEKDRYHLYVSRLPWAHRTLIFRKLKVWSRLFRFPSRESVMLGKRLDV